MVRSHLVVLGGGTRNRRAGRTLDPQRFQRRPRWLHRLHRRILARSADLFFGLIVCQVPTINHSSCPDRQVVDIGYPLPGVLHFASSTRGVRPIHNIAKVIRPIDWAKGQADREELPAPGHDCKHFHSPAGILDLVKAGHGVHEGKPDATRGRGKNIGGLSAVVRGPNDPRIDSSVVNYQSSLPMALMRWRLPSRKWWRSPRRSPAH